MKDYYRFDNIEDYKYDISPLKDYCIISADYLTKKKGRLITPEEVLEMIKKKGDVRNPMITHTERDLDGVTSKRKTKLLNYIGQVKKENKIMVPSLTIYHNAEEKPSLHSDFTQGNIKTRNFNKYKAFEHKMKGEMDAYLNHNTLQKSFKLYNNALSGTYAAQGTILNNVSAHYTLTSITRMTASIGNAVSESIIAGNKHFKDYDTTINHIATVVSSTDMNKVNEVYKEYNLTIPTTDDIINNILKSSNKYWINPIKMDYIRSYIEKLNDMEKVFLMYHNSLYNIRVLNPVLIKDLLYGFARIPSIEELNNVEEYELDVMIGKIEDWLDNLVKHVLVDVLKGKSFVKAGVPKNDKSFTIDDKKHIVLVYNNLKQLFNRFHKLMKVFFLTNIFPPNIANMKDMYREAIVLSDTDSTCATYQEWVEWLYGEIKVTPEAIAITAGVMTIVTGITDHYIKEASTNMNISYEKASHLKMKNEFMWDVYMTTNNNKHYFANVVIQEGNIFDFDDPLKTLEIKGVHLIASASYRDIVKESKNMMIELLQTVKANKNIDPNIYINKVMLLERDMTKKVKAGDSEVLKLEKIKNETSYKKEKELSPYLNHILWESVFSFKYGHAPEPTYLSIKVPVKIKNKTDMNMFIDSIKDTELKNNLVNFLTKYKKDTIKIFRLPIVLTYNNGIPKEILNYMDVNSAVKDNCAVLYKVLETIGVYVKPDKTLTESLGYTLEA